MNLRLVIIRHQHGYFGQARQARRAKTAFSRNDHIAAAFLLDDQRLHDAVYADRLRKLVERSFFKLLARLECVGVDLPHVDGQHAQAGFLRLVHRRGIRVEQSIESAPEPCLLRGHYLPSLEIISVAREQYAVEPALLGA